jgi:hypothetical protein
VLISGQDGAGKGEAINLLYEWMDSRFLTTLAFSEPTDEERERPPMWRYWRSLPPKGRLGIFAGSWYSDPIRQRIAGDISSAELDARAGQINRFEAMLANEGALILKFWFHLTKDAQRERLRALESDPRTAWRVSAWNWDRLKTYDQLQDAAGHLLRITNTAHAPGWCWRAMTTAIARSPSGNCCSRPAGAPAPGRASAPPPAPCCGWTPMAATCCRSSIWAAHWPKSYKTELAHWQGRLAELARPALPAPRPGLPRARTRPARAARSGASAPHSMRASTR